MTKDERWLLDEKYKGVATPEFEKDKARLERGEPVAYVIGLTPFLGLNIYLDSRPLIPRPETEWWAEELLRVMRKCLVESSMRRPEDFSKGTKQLRFIDLCSGSGAIGCAVLKHMPNAEVYFGEIDSAHEATIRKNISKNDLDAGRAHIGIGNLFEPFGGEMFDFIASNPPYIPSGRTLPESVEKWEPTLALRAGEDGLSVIRKIAEELPRRLREGGQAWIECDSAHAEAACALFNTKILKARVINDLYGNPRVVVVSYP